MTTGEKMIFPCEVTVHLEFKYHVASDLLVYRENLYILHLLHLVSAFVKGNIQINHLLLNVKLKLLFPVALPISKAYLTILGIMIQKLWFFCQYLPLNLEIIWYRKHSTYLTHHLNEGSSWNWLDIAYSTIATVLEWFKWTKVTHLEYPPFHSTYKV